MSENFEDFFANGLKTMAVILTIGLPFFFLGSLFHSISLYDHKCYAIINNQTISFNSTKEYQEKAFKVISNKTIERIVKTVIESNEDKPLNSSNASN